MSKDSPYSPSLEPKISQVSASSPEMICLNCKHYDTCWLNCMFLGFDGIRENPNMRCNVEITVDGQRRFGFEMRTPEEAREEEELIEKLLDDDTVHPE